MEAMAIMKSHCIVVPGLMQSQVKRNLDQKTVATCWSRPLQVPLTKMPPQRRIGQIHTHLTTASAPAAAETTPEGEPVPLTDEEVKSFIVDGFLLKEIDDVPREYHLAIYDKCVAERTRAAELPGRGRLQGGQESSHVAALDDFIFPTVPELGAVYASPKMRGATASLVGADYVMHPHRHMHSGMGGMDQNFHKDGHHVPMRHHRGRWIM